MKRIFVTAAAFSFLIACNNDGTGSTAGDTATDVNNAAGTGSSTMMDTSSMGTDSGMRTNNLGGTDTGTSGSGTTPGTAGSSSGASNSGSGGTRPGDSTRQ